MGNHGKRKKMSNRLEDKLISVHVDNIKDFLEENKNEIVDDEYAFSKYMRAKFKEKEILQQEVFLYADIPERYGYKLIAQKKHTKQRDIILRICYSAKFTIDETQKALMLYGMPQLHATFSRDVVIMVVFKDRPGDILKFNSVLVENGMKPLKSCGTLE